MCNKCRHINKDISIKEQFKRWLNNDFNGNGINDYREGE